MNNKGMTVIELIVSFSLTAIVVVLLLQLLISINKIYNIDGIKTELLTNQANLTKRIYKDLENKGVSNIVLNGESATLTLANGDTRIIKIDNSVKTITYNGKVYNYPNNVRITNLNVENIIGSTVDLGVDNAFTKISINITYPNVKGDYGITILLPYRNVS